MDGGSHRRHLGDGWENFDISVIGCGCIDAGMRFQKRANRKLNLQRTYLAPESRRLRPTLVLPVTKHHKIVLPRVLCNTVCPKQFYSTCSPTPSCCQSPTFNRLENIHIAAYAYLACELSVETFTANDVFVNPDLHIPHRYRYAVAAGTSDPIIFVIGMFCNQVREGLRE